MSAPIFVPDASVLLKWVLDSPDEPDRAHALTLRSAWLEGRCRLAVPALWAYEVGNVLGIKAPRQASELLALLFALKLDELPAQRTCNRALSLVRKLRVTFYDAVYHAVALELNGTLVTADARYLTRAGSEGHLVLLGKWGEV